jgi:uncharacterized protein (DUF362 family)
MKNTCTRRQFIRGVSAAAAGLWVSPPGFLLGSDPLTAPVSVARCRTYDSEVLPTLKTLFDQLGGLERLVKGKTVAVKLNLTGSPTDRLSGKPVELTSWVHPQVIGATVHLLGQAGANRIRLLESAMGTSAPLEEFVLKARWNPRDFLSAAPRVEFENTNFLGKGRKYSRLQVPGGGLLFRAYDVNHSYEDCDVFVSLAKLKEHGTAGVTLAMKNLFGLTPCTIYGDGAGTDEPSAVPRGGRGVLHDGNRQPPKSSPPENDPRSPREGGYRVPRITADLVAARPIHLAIIDGIGTMAGGEGSWIRGARPVRPGLLIAGVNCVTTDAVATALMGFDPMADRGTPPFESCDSTLRLAELLGVGTRDLRRIEVIGTRIQEAVFHFRTA